MSRSDAKVSMDEIDRLFERIWARIANPGREDCRPSGPLLPLDETEMSAAETRLGFSLPDALRALYMTIGNGGFGPDYGIIGFGERGFKDIESDLDAADVYHGLREPSERDPLWRWPEKLLPIVNLGCGMFLAVDCSNPDGPVVWFEPNPHKPGEPWDTSFFPYAPSTAAWLEGWLDGKDFFAQVACGEPDEQPHAG